MFRVTKTTPYLPLAAFLFLGVIWGSNFIYMKLASNLITPLQIVFLRVLFGFLPVMIYAYLSGALAWRHVKHAGHFLVMALLGTTLYYYVFVKGTSLLFSGVAGAVSGSIPLFSFVLAILFLPEEKINGSRILGLLGTGGAYIIYYLIVEKLGAVTASSVSYIPPVIALLIGALIVGEPIELIDYAAASIFFLGVFLLKRNSVQIAPLSATAHGPIKQPR
jgi:drug/metabolite transporter (DMT)-like permease